MLKKLIEKRKALLAKIDATINTAETEKRDLTAAESEQRTADIAAIAALDKEIETETQLAEHRSKQTDLETRSVTPRTVVGDVRTGLSRQEERDLNRYSMVRAFNVCSQRMQMGRMLSMMNPMLSCSTLARGCPLRMPILCGGTPYTRQMFRSCACRDSSN